MESTQKLTKKQKKALAFRTNTKRSNASSSSKSKSSSSTNNDQDHGFLDADEAGAIPVMEEQDVASDDGDTTQAAGNENQAGRKKGGNGQRSSEGGAGSGRVGKGKGEGKGERKEESLHVAESVVKGGKKRKRSEGNDGEEGDGAKGKGKDKRKGKRKADVKVKGGDENSVASDNEAGEGDETDKTSRKRRKVTAELHSKQRFILFVGNLKYTTPKEAIQAHFAKCDPPPTIRLLTPKNPTSNTQKAKSKGCAFLEFSHRNALQQALKLHQSTLDGRMINVELTAGGGGKSESRLAKVKERNKALSTQRTEKEVKNGGESAPSKPQRYSATSGVEQVPTTVRTWSVADGGETTKKRGKKGKGKPAKSWGTGVNSIPVG